MGHTQAVGMAEAVLDGTIGLDAALQYHLQHNHYPPVLSVFIPACKRAIALVNRGGGSRRVVLPGGRTRTARYIVEQLHLEPFLAAMSEEEA